MEKKILQKFVLPFKSYKENYEYIDEIGSGGFGSVDLAKDKKKNQQVAVKQIKIKQLEEEWKIQQNQIVQEIENSTRAVHDNIIRLKEYFICNDIFKGLEHLVLVMEYAEGGNLLKLQKQKGQLLSEAEIIKIFKQVVQGIQFLHKQKIVHRDIKMENIVFKDGVPKICDLGLSRAKRYTEQSISLCWSPPYQSPEQVRAEKIQEEYEKPHLKLDKRIDTWQLGILLYYMCTGDTPFNAGGLNNDQRLEKMQQNQLIKIDHETYSIFLLELIKKFLQFKPMDRIKLSDALKYLNILENIINKHKEENYISECEKLNNQGIKTLQQLIQLMEQKHIQNQKIEEDKQQNKQQFSESQLLQNQNKRQWLIQQIQSKIKFRKIQMIFNGSKNGFGYEEFHQKCNNKGPLLFLFKSGKGCIFGAFITTSFQSDDRKYYRDKKAFLFQLDKQTRHDVKAPDNAIYTSPSNLIGFGPDLRIFNNCNQRNDSWSWFGDSYTLPAGIEKWSDEAKAYLAGSYEFTVEEMEVFQLLE